MAENVLDVMVALYPFKAQNDTELSFDKGDRLEVLDRPPSDPEWFKARNQCGQIGLVPSNYLVELSQFLTQDVGNRGGGGPGQLAPGPNAHQAATNGKNGTNGFNSGANENITSKPWYFGLISRGDCDTIMAEKGQDGDFLVRDSESNTGDFSVSLKAPGRNKHFRVHVDNGMYCIGQRKFISLQQLVDHYQRAPIYTSQKGEKLFLIKPLPK
jgi:NCK adaptor protein